MVLDLLDLDYDWSNAFAVACDAGGITVDPTKDIEEVIASVEGENEGADWQCVVRFKDGRFAWLSASCDYTGWDCGRSGKILFAPSLERLLDPMFSELWLRDELVTALNEKGIGVKNPR